MPHQVLRQFLWELKAGDSYERVAKEKELTALNSLGNSTLGIGASSVCRRGIDGSKVVLRSLHYIVVAINARPGHTTRRCCAGSPNDRCEREPETLKVCRTSFPLYSRRCNAILNSAVQCQWK
jgi:hypothetical protein